MSKQRFSDVVRMLPFFLSALVFSACGGGGGGGDGAPPAPVNVAGTWNINEVIDNTACGRTGDTDSYQVTVTQSGTSITVVADGDTFNGSVNGNQVSWTGQFFNDDPEVNGWITITSMTVTVTGDSLSGSVSWQFRDTQTGPVVCSGTTQVTGQRIGGGSGGSGGVSIAQLAGTWFGTLEDSAGDMHTITVSISGSAITGIAIDGVPTYTGTISKESAQVFSFVLNDSTEGGFFVDSTANYAAFLDEEFKFGVVQKGATTLPSYSTSDINGAWSGIAITTDFLTFTETPSSASCALPACTASGGGVTSTASFQAADFDAPWGRWRGTYTASDSTSGFVNAFLSPDKAFAGTWACESSFTFPDVCEFSAWRRQ